MKQKKAACLIMAAALTMSGSTAVMTENTAGTVVMAEEQSEAGEILGAAEDTELAAGQRKATIKVVSITGNELTYYEIAQETEVDEAEENKTSEGNSEKNTIVEEKESVESETEETELAGVEAAQANAESESGQRQNKERSDDFDPSQMGSGEMPQNFDTSQMGSGETSQNVDPSQLEGGEMSQRFDPSQMEKSGKAGNRNIETKTVYLSVAVVVHTNIGEEMTFSILEAGDELEVLLEEDEEGEEVITEIWMKSTEG